MSESEDFILVDLTKLVADGGGQIHLPAGEWVPVAGGFRRLWGDGVHDDTEAVQAYYDRFGKIPDGTYTITGTLTVRP